MTNNINILKNPEQDATLKTELKELAESVDIWESNFESINNLFEKINELDESNKQKALQYALYESNIKAGNGTIKLLEIAKIFEENIEQIGDTWKIKAKENAELGDKSELIEKLLNEKESPFAYLIQKSAQLITLHAARGYGVESEEKLAIWIDKVFWNQTRRALEWLKDWVESDLDKSAEEIDVTTLTVDDILNMKFISKELKDKITESGNEEIKGLWDNVSEQDFLRPYTNNYALKKSVEESEEGDIEGGNELTIEEISDLDALPEDTDWKEGIVYQYTTTDWENYIFQKDGKAINKETQEEINSAELVASLKRIESERQQYERKKQNLIRNLQLTLNKDNPYYSREWYLGIYTFWEKWNLYYSGRDYGNMKFMWGKEDNRINVSQQNLPQEFAKTAIIEWLELKVSPYNPLYFEREWYSWLYAFWKDGNLYYSWTDHGNLMFLWIKKTEITQKISNPNELWAYLWELTKKALFPPKEWENISSIPEEISEISI